MKRFLFASLLAALLSPAVQAGNRVSIDRDVHVSVGETVDNALAVFGSVFVDGNVTQNAVSLFGSVNVGPKGHVGGDVVSFKGSKKFLLVGLPMAAAAAAMVGAVLVVASSVGFIALVVLILVFFEGSVAFARTTVETAPLRSLAYGLIGFLALLPVCIFLTVIIIGIPLAIAVASIELAAMCLGSVAVCEWIGRELGRRFKREFQPVWAGLLGLSVLFLVGVIPIVGTVAHILAVFAGFGAVIQTRFKAAPIPL